MCTGRGGNVAKSVPYAGLTVRSLMCETSPWVISGAGAGDIMSAQGKV